MSAHTPGAWSIEPTYYTPATKGGKRVVTGCYVRSAEHDAICKVDGVDKTSKADARLIAAAPDLLEALRYVLLVAKGAEMLLTGEAMGPRQLGEADREFIRQADALIAKVEGA